MKTASSAVSAEHLRCFQEDGFCVLDGVLPPQDLQTLRSECQRFIAAREAEMDRLGMDVLDLDHRGRRYFVHAYAQSESVRHFLAGDFMAGISGAILGDDVYLFNEQYVVKAAERGMQFGWHQDSGFIDYPHTPYLTCWIALDNVTDTNGTVYLLPYDRAGTREVVPHVWDATNHDRVGYFGPDPGDAVIAPAGSIACFSSTVLHRSGANTTNNTRRVYVAQYSAEPILTADGAAPRHLAVRLLEGGKRRWGHPSSNPRT
jgi:ectoine hydroxylase-related dioxygenase (phytanoyl-CoA dioxygenase family)